MGCRCGWFLLTLVVVVISIAVPIVILDDDPVDWRIKYLLDPMSTTHLILELINLLIIEDRKSTRLNSSHT